MTDKQIIIDGVDVSGCEKQGETIAGITCGNGERIRLANEIVTKHKLCKDNPNCVYKQLKRKEQEYDRLKYDNDYEVGALEKTIDNLTAENKDLERLYKELQDDMLACNKCRTTIKLQQQLNQLKEDNEELRNAHTRLNSLYSDNCNFTDKLEKQFFDTFGIEPDITSCYHRCKKDLNCKECNEAKVIYPQITDHTLLELLCIAHTSPVITFVSRDVKSLKEEVLMVLCNWVNNRNIKQQVRALFKEYNNDR